MRSPSFSAMVFCFMLIVTGCGGGGGSSGKKELPQARINPENAHQAAGVADWLRLSPGIVLDLISELDWPDSLDPSLSRAIQNPMGQGNVMQALRKSSRVLTGGAAHARGVDLRDSAEGSGPCLKGEIVQTKTSIAYRNCVLASDKNGDDSSSETINGWIAIDPLEAESGLEHVARFDVNLTLRYQGGSSSSAFQEKASGVIAVSALADTFKLRNAQYEMRQEEHHAESPRESWGILVKDLELVAINEGAGVELTYSGQAAYQPNPDPDGLAGFVSVQTLDRLKLNEQAEFPVDGSVELAGLDETKLLISYQFGVGQVSVQLNGETLKEFDDHAEFLYWSSLGL